MTPSNQQSVEYLVRVYLSLSTQCHNENLYKGCRPLAERIAEMFGHVLRSGESTPIYHLDLPVRTLAGY